MKTRISGRLAVTASAVALLASACAGGAAETDAEVDGDAETSQSTEGEDGAAADAFPERRIELVVPWAAGGGTDQIARQLAAAAEDECGWSIAVSNKDGANGSVGHKYVADAEADGYTILSADSTLNTYIHNDLADVGPDDFQAIMRHNDKYTVVAVHADLPYDTIEQLLEAAETEDLSLATTPPGAGNHSAAAGMALAADVDFTYVPYDGGAVEQITGVLSGEADAVVADDAELLPHIESGDLRPLAIMTDERSPILPDTPTLKESGVDWSFSQWRGLVVPEGTPDGVVGQIHDCFKLALEQDEFTDFMESNGFPISYLPTEDFESFMDEDFERTGQLLADLEEL